MTPILSDLPWTAGEGGVVGGAVLAGDVPVGGRPGGHPPTHGHGDQGQHQQQQCHLLHVMQEDGTSLKLRHYSQYLSVSHKEKSFVLGNKILIGNDVYLNLNPYSHCAQRAFSYFLCNRYNVKGEG